MKTLIIDNHDSFTHNLEHLVASQTQTAPTIIPYAQWTPNSSTEGIDLIIISAGPGHPTEYPSYQALFNKTHPPILGICLGMQIITVNCGGSVTKLPDCIHGQTDTLQFQNKSLSVARYHSLYVDQAGKNLDIILRNTNNIPMAIRHKTRPILGYQFHPESFLTNYGPLFLSYALDTLLPNNKTSSTRSTQQPPTAVSG